MSMNKKDLIKAIAENTGETQATVTRVVDGLLDGITEQLAAGEEVTIPGFGKFATSVRAARTGRNPQTGAPVEIPETRSPAFKAGKGLKDAVKG